MNQRNSSVPPIKPRLAALMVGLPANPRKRKHLTAKDFSPELRREIRDYFGIELSSEDAGAKFHLTARQVLEVCLYESMEVIKTKVRFGKPFGEKVIDSVTVENVTKSLKAGKPPLKSKAAHQVYWCFANDFACLGSLRQVQHRYGTSWGDTEEFVIRFARRFCV